MSKIWNRLVLERLAATGPDVADRVLMLPRMREDRFFDLVRVADVVLDPFHYGGGNTSYETLAVGTPIVTLPAAFMRGRVTLGAYRQMGIDGLIVGTPDEYIDLAIAIANDPARRAGSSQDLYPPTRSSKTMPRSRKSKRILYALLPPPSRHGNPNTLSISTSLAGMLAANG